MNPNSQHQRWSFWEYRVYPDSTKRPTYELVKKNAARFGRLLFGSASQMRLTCATDDVGRLYWEIAVLTEGHPVHEPGYVSWVHHQWAKFCRQGFGQTCEIRSHARLEAGDREDGRPADQLIMLPPLSAEGV
jgi:hypothetical protein